MLFMNTWEVDEAVDRYKAHPILKHATRLLADLRDIVDENSDGWAYWSAPVNAAKRLIELIQNGRNNPAAVTEAQYKQAVTPIKSFYTKHKDKLYRSPPLVFPGLKLK